jgi:anaerobic selenocysteine-containing dehydrogenase
MLVESGNPAALARRQQAHARGLRALELSVVIDVAMTETARVAHYVLPAASQFEKCRSDLLQLRCLSRDNASSTCRSS